MLDIGAGDGRWAYEQARRDPGSLYIALDPDAEALKEYAFRAARKPARGGAANALFVVGSVEAPPPELLACADELRVNFPWAALLRGLLLADRATLRGLSSLGKPGARFELVLTYDPAHDHGAGLDASVPPLDAGVFARLAEPYAASGLRIEECRPLGRDEALAIPSTWGRRLLHGRERSVFQLSGHVVGASDS
ncbi:MAG TPA: class I SAM-dependent methyltransferase [Dehalococcoidia bacterium]|nr:class I SAM-dependent methyltransferase [Dehalococcoidia bacterium]